MDNDRINTIKEKNKRDNDLYHCIKNNKSETYIRDLNRIIAHSPLGVQNNLSKLVTHAIYTGDTDFVDKAVAYLPSSLICIPSYIASAEVGNEKLFTTILNVLATGSSSYIPSSTAVMRAFSKRNFVILDALLQQLRKYFNFNIHLLIDKAIVGNDIEMCKFLFKERKPQSSHLKLAIGLKRQEIIELIIQEREIQLALPETILLSALNNYYFTFVMKVMPDSQRMAYLSDFMKIASAAGRIDMVENILAQSASEEEKIILNNIHAKWKNFPEIEDDVSKEDINLCLSMTCYPVKNAKDYAAILKRHEKLNLRHIDGFLQYAILCNDIEALEIINADFKDELSLASFEGNNIELYHSVSSDAMRSTLMTKDWFIIPHEVFSITGDLHYLKDIEEKLAIYDAEVKALIKCYNIAYQVFKDGNSTATRALQALSCTSKTFLSTLIPDINNKICLVIYSDIDLLKAPLSIDFRVAHQYNTSNISYACKLHFAQRLQKERDRFTVCKTASWQTKNS